MSLTFYCLNGPNLNLLGEREPEIYGTDTLEDLEKISTGTAKDEKSDLVFRQTNSEGELVDWIQEANKCADGLIINAAAYTHTSIAIHDALKTLTIPVIELHLSNPSNRESFRKKSYVAPCADGVIAGFGALGYRLSVNAIAELARKRS